MPTPAARPSASGGDSSSSRAVASSRSYDARRAVNRARSAAWRRGLSMRGLYGLPRRLPAPRWDREGRGEREQQRDRRDRERGRVAALGRQAGDLVAGDDRRRELAAERAAD